MMIRNLVLFVLFCSTLIPSIAPAATKVDFDARGMCRVDGKPFFPIGIWVYSLDTNVMADLHEHHFNTIVGIGFSPKDLPLIEEHGMMCIPSATDEWVLAAKASPSLLAWYLEDEPEEHGLKPEDIRKKFDALRARDAEHPIGLTHCQLAGPEKYKDSCDFTMTDLYPITAKRDFGIHKIGIHIDKTREIHGTNWPNFTFVQTFGGPQTDGGIWAQPLPHEVRCMAFLGLLHRSNGIMYFSYWPQAPQTWASIVDLNRDINRLTPWLLAEGEEVKAETSDKAVEIRAKSIGGGWMVIVVNTSPKTANVTLNIPSLPDSTLRVMNEDLDVQSAGGKWSDRFGAFEAKVYLAGSEPKQS